MKNENGIFGASDLYVKYYCSEEAVLIYYFKDSMCTEDF